MTFNLRKWVFRIFVTALAVGVFRRPLWLFLQECMDTGGSRMLYISQRPFLHLYWLAGYDVEYVNIKDKTIAEGLVAILALLGSTSLHIIVYAGLLFILTNAYAWSKKASLGWHNIKCTKGWNNDKPADWVIMSSIIGLAIFAIGLLGSLIA